MKYEEFITTKLIIDDITNKKFMKIIVGVLDGYG
jgi:hypothetical protein